MDFKDQWNMEMAMQVLVSDSVDSTTWAEAVKWLILYGPLELQKVLLDASGQATRAFFPELKPSAFSRDGEPLYRMDHIAEALGVNPDSMKENLENSLSETGAVLLHAEEDTFKIQ